MKKLIILCLILVLSTSLVTASFTDKATEKIICKAAQNFCTLFKTILNPQAKITQELVGVFPQEIQKTIITAQDPVGTAKSEMFKLLPKDALRMINNAQEVESYLKDIGQDPDKEKIDSEYTDKGEFLIRDKNNNIIGKIPKGFETIEGEEGELIFVNKEAPEQAVLQLGEFQVSGAQKNSQIRITETKDTKSIFIDKGYIDLNIGGASYNKIADAEFRVKDNEVEYAQFVSGGGNQKYDFLYKAKNYTFISGTYPGSIITFDPTNKKASIITGSIKTIDRYLECSRCDIILDNNFNMNKVTITKGLFSDNLDKIKVEGDKFKICLSSHPIDQFDKVMGCEGDNIFWLNKDRKTNANTIRTKGKLDYSVGFTDVSTSQDSETKFIQSSDLRNIISVSKGKANINKDGIKSIITYKPCGKINTAAVIGFFIAYENKKSCGTLVKLERESISSKITEDLYVVPLEGDNLYNVDPMGKIFVKDNKGRMKFGETNPLDSKIKEDLDMFYSQNFPNVAGTSVTIADSMERYISSIKPEPSVFDSLSIAGVKGKKEDAIQELNQLNNRINKFSNLVYEGYPVDAALIESDLDKEEISMFYKEGINFDGSINYQKIPSILNQLKISCSGNTYSEMACLKSADFVSSLYKEKIKTEYYKDIPNGIKNKLTGNPQLDKEILERVLPGIARYDKKELNKYQNALKDIKKTEQVPELATFIATDTELAGQILVKEVTAIGMENIDYLVVLGLATKGVKYAFKGGVNFAKNVGRMERYIEGIKDTRYFATIKSIREGKIAKSLIKTDDLPEIVRACI